VITSSDSSSRRRAGIHYRLAITGYLAALVVAALNVWAYYDERLVVSQIGFAAAGVATLILLTTWFWGVFMVMNGRIMTGRVVYLLFHATLGSISSLLYTMVIGLQMDSLGSQPVSGLDVSLELAAVAALSVQIISGWLMLNRWPWGRKTP